MDLGRVRGSEVAPIENPPTTSKYIEIETFAPAATVWSEFRWQSCAAQIGRIVLGEFGWMYGAENGKNRNLDPHGPTRLHYMNIDIYCDAWPRYTTIPYAHSPFIPDRQADKRTYSFFVAIVEMLY